MYIFHSLGTWGRLLVFFQGRTRRNEWFELYEQKLKESETPASVNQLCEDWKHFIKLRLLGNVCMSKSNANFPTRFEIRDNNNRTTRICTFADPPDEADWRMIMEHLNKCREHIEKSYKLINDEFR